MIYGSKVIDEMKSLATDKEAFMGLTLTQEAALAVVQYVKELRAALKAVKEYFGALESIRQTGDEGTRGGDDYELHERCKMDNALKAAGIEIDLTWPHS
jgi:hypothetical protein